MKKTGRAIIFKDNKLITIKRTKYDENGNIAKTYYTFPGGHLEDGEDFESATIREVEEELGIIVNITEKLCHIYNDNLKQEEEFFICKYMSGKIGTGTGEEWQNVDLAKYGKYEIEYIEKEKINEYNLLPVNVKKILIEKICSD